MNHFLNNKQDLLRRVIVVYYFLISILIFFIMRPNETVPTITRFVFLAVVLFPVLFKTEFLPFAILCFYGISSASFAVILPTNTIYYLAITLVFYAYYPPKSRFIICESFFLLYFVLCCLIHGDIQEFLGWGAIAMMLGDFVRKKSDVKILLYAFLLISLFLSVLFLVYRDDFIVEYVRYGDEAERTKWINSNYLGAIIAAGGVLSVAYLTNLIQLVRTDFLRILSPLTLLLSFPVIVLNSSRGAFLAFTIPSVIMMLLSRIKVHYKLLLVIAAAFMVYLLYYSESFTLLAMRMEDESFGSVGLRSFIWKEKLHLFWEDQSFMHHLIGIGRNKCTDLANQLSTHNDFLTALIGYGISGLVLFIAAIVYPIVKARKETKTVVGMFLLYLILECFVLEPVFRGYFVLIMFYFFVLRYSMIDKKSRENET